MVNKIGLKNHEGRVPSYLLNPYSFTLVSGFSPYNLPVRFYWYLLGMVPNPYQEERPLQSPSCRTSRACSRAVDGFSLALRFTQGVCVHRIQSCRSQHAGDNTRRTRIAKRFACHARPQRAAAAAVTRYEFNNFIRSKKNLHNKQEQEDSRALEDREAEK